jgi:TPR repeat protein
VAPDLEEARSWFARAVESGLADAQVALGEMMLNGRGGSRSPTDALELFDRAAAKGHSGAMFALGAIHAGGHEVTTDRQAAQRWFRAATELGQGHAQLMLGRYLVAGTAGAQSGRRTLLA